MIKFFRRLRLLAIKDYKLGTYLRYALGEIILVVIGILIALEINNRNELSKYEALEEVYLDELLIDFEANLEQSLETIDWIEFMVPRLMTLLKQSAQEKADIPLDSINYYVSLIQGMPTYLSTDRVYNNLLGSGDFKVISDRNLKNQIAGYYQAVDLIKVVQSTHEMQLVTSYQPYIVRYMDFQAIQGEMFDDVDMPVPVDNARALEVLHEPEFRNIVTLKLNILSDLLDQNNGIRDLNIEMISILKELVNHP